MSSGCNQHASARPWPFALLLLVLSLPKLLPSCSFPQLWHPENGGNQRSATGERGDSQRRGERTPRACVSPCSCVSSPSLQNRTFVPNHWITHERLPAMSWLLPLGCTLKLSRLIRKTQLKLFILLAMHKVEMQKEVKPVDCWLRSDPGNLGLPSTASQ